MEDELSGGEENDSRRLLRKKKGAPCKCVELSGEEK